MTLNKRESIETTDFTLWRSISGRIYVLFASVIT